jgi:hypothetical protein
MTIRKTDELKKLLEDYIAIYNSDKNKQVKRLWVKTRALILDKWRGIPRDLSDTGGKIPFVSWPGFDIWRKILNLDIGRYHNNPEYFLKNWLKMKVYYANNFDDDNYYSNTIPLWMGEGFESTLFGMKMLYSKDFEPWIDRKTAPLSSNEDINILEIESFKNKGLMPLAIQFYEEVSDVVNDYGLIVDFASWGNGPTATANYLRGIEKMSMDYLLNPEFANKLFNLIVNARIAWFKYRTEYLGGRIGEYQHPEIWNDDAAVPIISPDIFKNIIWKHEKKLYDFQGGFSYYHNCGPMDPFLEDIAKFNNIEMIHAGPFSDYRKILKKFGKRCAIEHHVKPQDDCMKVKSSEILKKFKKLKNDYEEFKARAVTIRLTAYYNPGISIDENISKIREWTKAGRKVLG